MWWFGVKYVPGIYFFKHLYNMIAFDLLLFKPSEKYMKKFKFTIFFQYYKY